MIQSPESPSEIAGWFGVDLGIDVMLLRPERIGRVLVLEIANQVAAVELAAPDIAGKRSQPCAAEQTAGIAHRVLSAHTRPIG